MTVAEWKEKLSKFPDDMRVVCWDGGEDGDGCYDDPTVTYGILRGGDEHLHYGLGAREDAEDVNACRIEDGEPAQELLDVCVIAPGYV